jgi:hypothetical protein
MTINEDYYVINRAGGSQYPLLEWDQRSGIFSKGLPVTVTEPIKLRLGAPVPKKPVMVDYHSLPEPVVGQKIFNVLNPLDIDGTQLHPADVKMPDGEKLRYWLLHVFNEIICVDRDKSKVSLSRSGRVQGIDRLVLDEDILQNIPLEKRLIFVLKESVSTCLFHKSIMDAVMAVNPVGCRFFPVTSWNDDSSFT